MIKLIEAIVVLVLLLFSFFIGVKYSQQVKERAGWLFESKEEEIELPNINEEGAVEIEVPEGENQEVTIEEEIQTAPESAPVKAQDHVTDQNPKSSSPSK